ncbi:hypothetical protein [Chryseobacterium balustinum]|uniref:Lipocalin-like domain-containing protein n=1 Tax=Chryseobacterium balustinum TaxID=246 RepID=A0ABY1LFC0_9FLAO|nr:hypothetical protein [Chryseobacterium balustinum]AZB28661.1 hypothetical protein EB354_04965 [Chryseobacterium balustinum]SKC14186.1 hypothetical protein SAMN05421800_1504 [Chryseobacterium balustinum]
MKKIVLLFVILFYYSCNNKIENILSTEEKWIMKAEENDQIIFIGQSFKFKDNGTYQYYHSFNKKDAEEMLNVHGQIERRWYLKKDDSIYLGDRSDKNLSYKIIKYNSDTLWLKNSINSFLLIKYNK